MNFFVFAFKIFFRASFYRDLCHFYRFLFLFLRLQHHLKTNEDTNLEFLKKISSVPYISIVFSWVYHSDFILIFLFNAVSLPHRSGGPYQFLF